MNDFTHITEQSLIDSGVLLTREDSAIRSRMCWIARHHYEYGDRKDAALMALAGAKSELKRAVGRIVAGDEFPPPKEPL